MYIICVGVLRLRINNFLFACLDFKIFPKVEKYLQNGKKLVYTYASD